MLRTRIVGRVVGPVGFGMLETNEAELLSLTKLLVLEA